MLIVGCHQAVDKKMETGAGVQYADTLACADPYFNQAYNEMAAMLCGARELSFKRAVFLTEWAYLQGAPDYDAFCRDIAATAHLLKKFTEERGVARYKTAGNFALFEYFTRPCKLNGNRPFTYDFEDFTGKKDWRQVFVTKLMQTHKGNCRSLPYYYKILADEMHTEAFLAMAPNHLFIKHLDEQGRWVNVELTNGNFSTDAWMMASTGMSAEAIQNGLYLEALDLKKSVAYCLTELATGYQRKYGYDVFGLLCCDKTLDYFPRSIHTLMQKHNTLRMLGDRDALALRGGKPTPEMTARHADFQRNQALIESLGYRELSPEQYEQWLKTVETEKNKQLVSNF